MYLYGFMLVLSRPRLVLIYIEVCITPAKAFVFQGSSENLANTQHSDESVKVIFSMQIGATMFCQQLMLEKCVRPNLENVNSQVKGNPAEAHYYGAAIYKVHDRNRAIITSFSCLTICAPNSMDMYVLGGDSSS